MTVSPCCMVVENSLEGYKMITNEEIDTELRKLAVWDGKGRFTVEPFWILLFESYSERGQNWQTDRQTHTHTHMRRAQNSLSKEKRTACAFDLLYILK